MTHKKGRTGRRATKIRRGSAAEARIRADPNLQLGKGGVSKLASTSQKPRFFVGGKKGTSKEQNTSQKPPLIFFSPL